MVSEIARRIKNATDPALLAGKVSVVPAILSLRADKKAVLDVRFARSTYRLTNHPRPQDA